MGHRRGPANVAVRLTRWFRANGRAFPWRAEESTDYELAVAEVLLQKTKAVDAEPVWRELISRYPTPASLADASRGDVRSVVRSLGLGNQRTARLIALAHSIVDGTGLAGIGPYGRAVVCLSSGHDISAPPVDGNVARVMQRVLGLTWDRGEGRKKREIREAMTEYLAATPVPLSALYAVVDFGALVCTPTRPRCPDCPLLDLCAFADPAG